MIRLAFVGDLGSGKSFFAKKLNYPVFNADLEVSKIYKKDRKFFNKLQKAIPNLDFTFPLNKKDLINCIILNNKNLSKITKIIHPIINKKLKVFLEKNKKKKYVVLDIPLYLENKLNKKNDIIIFIQSNRNEIKKRLLKRKEFNEKIFKIFKKIQLPLYIKRKKSNFIIKNDFSDKKTKKNVKYILDQIQK